MTESREYKAAARAHANIAVAKYWGKRDEALNLPLFDSVSFSVAGLTTETSAVWDDVDAGDGLVIDGVHVPPHGMGRVRRMLDEIRRRTGLEKRCILHSSNSFPMSAGLASSASGFAAAALAASVAAGLDLAERELSALARLGSGSAARSIPAGWARWRAGESPDGADSYAVSIAPPEHWPLHVFAVLVSGAPKPVPSTEAMLRCRNSPFWDAYVRDAGKAADQAQDAVMRKDFSALRDAMHHNAMTLHALAMSCSPPICYFAPKSIELLAYILRASRSVSACCTLDAGANVVVLCDDDACLRVKNDIAAMGLAFVESRIGGGASLI